MEAPDLEQAIDRAQEAVSAAFDGIDRLFSAPEASPPGYEPVDDLVEGLQGLEELLNYLDALEILQRVASLDRVDAPADLQRVHTLAETLVAVTARERRAEDLEALAPIRAAAVELADIVVRVAAGRLRVASSRETVHVRDALAGLVARGNPLR